MHSRLGCERSRVQFPEQLLSKSSLAPLIRYWHNGVALSFAMDPRRAQCPCVPPMHQTLGPLSLPTRSCLFSSVCRTPAYAGAGRESNLKGGFHLALIKPGDLTGATCKYPDRAVPYAQRSHTKSKNAHWRMDRNVRIKMQSPAPVV